MYYVDIEIFLTFLDLFITNYILLRTIVNNYPILDRYFHRNFVVFFYERVFLFTGVMCDIFHVFKKWFSRV